MGQRIFFSSSSSTRYNATSCSRSSTEGTTLLSFRQRMPPFPGNTTEVFLHVHVLQNLFAVTHCRKPSGCSIYYMRTSRSMSKRLGRTLTFTAFIVVTTPPPRAKAAAPQHGSNFFFLGREEIFPKVGPYDFDLNPYSFFFEPSFKL